MQHPRHASGRRRHVALASGAAAALLAGGLVAIAPTTAGADPVAPRQQTGAVGTPTGFAAVAGWGQSGTTGGAGGATVTVSTADAFLDAIATAGPLIIQVDGAIELPGPMHDVTSDKTIVGLGADAALTGGGLNIGLPIDDSVTAPPDDAVHNVIVQNLTFDDWADDAINVQMFSHHVWIDHNTFVGGYDGAADVKRGSSFVTMSWNHSTHGKNMLVGHNPDNGAQDVGRLNVTYHHNWFDGTVERNPWVRFADPAHVYNNYYLDISDYGVRSSSDAAVLVEGNYFENVPEPFQLDVVGTQPGNLESRDNCFVNSGDPVTRGTVNGIPYDYTVQPCEEVPATVTAGAGAGNISPGEDGEDRQDGEGGDAGDDAAPVAQDAPVGYASMNGGTTGGFGAATVNEVVLSEYWPTTGHDNPGDAMYELLQNHEETPEQGLVIYVDETVSGDAMAAEDMRLEGVRNVSILGVGDQGEFDGVGLNLIEADNIVVRNLTIHHVVEGTGDGISIQRNSTNVWVDHNEIYNEYPDVDKDHYDALIDVRKGSEYITISWNHLHHSWKTGLTASSDSEGEAGDLITYANNWFHDVNSRVPLVRHSHVHMLNNYLQDVADTAINARMGAQVLVESNYFENVGNGEPDEVTGQIHGPVGWFYGSEETGYWNLVDNAYAGTTPYEHLQSTSDFTVPYAYEATSPEVAKEQVTQAAGVGVIDVTP
ncbi:pectate lyase family protein [Streptomyces sp. 4N509B]|uniref:pectate lyase family protein n=1 Tax=Streptomyces sp. 4N509B TaxID=3457413 RepID=UPI003FD63D6E